MWRGPDLTAKETKRVVTGGSGERSDDSTSASQVHPGGRDSPVRSELAEMEVDQVLRPKYPSKKLARQLAPFRLACVHCVLACRKTAT